MIIEFFSLQKFLLNHILVLIMKSME